MGLRNRQQPRGRGKVWFANAKQKTHSTRRLPQRNDSTKEAGIPKGKPELIRIDEGEIRNRLDQIVRGTVEETLNALLEAEADAICRASRYERSPERTDTRAGHYDRKLQTRVGEVTLKMPKLRNLPFETAIIERYRRRESSTESG